MAPPDPASWHPRDLLGDLREFLALDREFHLSSYAGCPSDRLVSTIGRT